MKIIQSHAHYDTGSVYILNNDLDGSETYLSFYCFLLSYLTLKKHYGHVTMYTNQRGYDLLIRHIPYDEVVIKENKNNRRYWSMYKVDSLNENDCDVVHVDSDVFIFDRLFDPYMSDDCDGIIQNIIPPQVNRYFTHDFAVNNKNKLNDLGFFNVPYDGTCFSCGVLGIKKKYLKEFCKTSYSIKSLLDGGELHADINIYAGICEEFAYYMFTKNNGLNVYSILPYDEILRDGGSANKVATRKKYTHMWFANKFKKKNIDLIKRKIEVDFPNMYHYVDSFENMLINNNITLKYL